MTVKPQEGEQVTVENEEQTTTTTTTAAEQEVVSHASPVASEGTDMKQQAPSTTEACASDPPPLAAAGFPDTKPVVETGATAPHPVFTRNDEKRLGELTKRETDPEEEPLNPEEREELKDLAARYQVFLDEGEKALRAGAPSAQVAGGSNHQETLRKVVTGTSNALITAGKGAFFWGSLVATAVPGYLGKQTGLTRRFDHWNWLSNKLILGALPVVTSVGSSGNHLEQLKQQLEHRKMKLGLVVACLEHEEMAGFGVGVLHFATEDRWKQHLGLQNYEHLPMPDTTAQVKYEAVKHAVTRMHTTMHDKDEVVYVHCKAGKGRSWMVVMCYLLTYGGMDWNTAKVTVESGRHQVHPGHSQQAFAQEFARRFNSEHAGGNATSSSGSAPTSATTSSRAASSADASEAAAPPAPEEGSANN